MTRIAALPTRGGNGPHSLLWSYMVRSLIVCFFVQFGGTMFPLGLIPGVQKVAAWANQITTGWDNWFIYGYTITDGVLGLAGGAIWLGLEQLFRSKRKHEGLLYEILRIEARYTLGACMFGFGFIKFIVNDYGPPAMLHQPDFPGLVRLFGEMSPHSIFWEWVGVAPTYSHFTGVVEMIGGVLMFSSRTSILGLGLNAASLVNIAVMSSAYGNEWSPWLPGRRFFLVWFLLYDEWPRIKIMLLRDADVVPPKVGYVWSRPWMRTVVVVAQVIFLARAGQKLYEHFWVDWVIPRPRGSIEAIYEVEEFSRTGQASADSLLRARWVRVGIYGCRGSALTMGDQQVRFSIVPAFPDTACAPIPGVTWSRSRHPSTDTLRYVRDVRGTIRATGVLKADSAADTVVVTLRRIPDPQVALFDSAWWWTKPASRD